MLCSMPALTELESIPIDLVASILHGRLDFAFAVPTDAQTSAYVILLTCGSKLQRALQHLDTSPPFSVLWEPYPQVRYCTSALPEPQSTLAHTQSRQSCRIAPTMVFGTGCKGTQAVRILSEERGK